MYAYKWNGNARRCSQCDNGSRHYYVTQKHKIIIGSKQDLGILNFPNCIIEEFDITKSDLDETIQAGKAYPELFK